MTLCKNSQYLIPVLVQVAGDLIQPGGIQSNLTTDSHYSAFSNSARMHRSQDLSPSTRPR
jgi:hypothetical protein